MFTFGGTARRGPALRQGASRSVPGCWHSRGPSRRRFGGGRALRQVQLCPGAMAPLWGIAAGIRQNVTRICINLSSSPGRAKALRMWLLRSGLGCRAQNAQPVDRHRRECAIGWTSFEGEERWYWLLAQARVGASSSMRSEGTSSVPRASSWLGAWFFVRSRASSISC